MVSQKTKTCAALSKAVPFKKRLRHNASLDASDKAMYSDSVEESHGPLLSGFPGDGTPTEYKRVPGIGSSVDRAVRPVSVDAPF